MDGVGNLFRLPRHVKDGRTSNAVIAAICIRLKMQGKLYVAAKHILVGLVDLFVYLVLDLIA